nr:MAG TPA: hypothetical protein [Caudoviricetes sp.]
MVSYFNVLASITPTPHLRGFFNNAKKEHTFHLRS